MKRKFAMGCAIVLLLGVIVTAVLISTAPKLVRKVGNWFSASMAEANRLAAVEKKWQPPSDTVQTDWFPPRVGEWSLAGASKVDVVPELNLKRPSAEATYVNGRDGKITVTIVPVSKSEHESLLHEAGEKLGEKSNSVAIKVLNGAYVVPNHNTRLWWIKEWLFMFHSAGAEDPGDFTEAFIPAMSSPLSADTSEPLEQPAARSP